MLIKQRTGKGLLLYTSQRKVKLYAFQNCIEQTCEETLSGGDKGTRSSLN